MSVYVDDMRARFGRLIMCHMIADTDEELRAMASAIGIAQRWHQGDHFDIALSKRALAVANGAIEITWRQAGCMIAVQKRTGKMPGPADAVGTLIALHRDGRMSRSTADSE